MSVGSAIYPGVLTYWYLPWHNIQPPVFLLYGNMVCLVTINYFKITRQAVFCCEVFQLIEAMGRPENMDLEEGILQQI